MIKLFLLLVRHSYELVGMQCTIYFCIKNNYTKFPQCITSVQIWCLYSWVRYSFKVPMCTYVSIILNMYSIPVCTENLSPERRFRPQNKSHVDSINRVLSRKRVISILNFKSVRLHSKFLLYFRTHIHS